MSEDKKRIDPVQVGGGGITGAALSLVAMFMMQDQGIEKTVDYHAEKYQIISKNQAQNSVKIENLEKLYQAAMASQRTMNQKLDAGFLRLENMIQARLADRWSRADHREFSRQIGGRIDRLEKDIDYLKDQKQKKIRR